ncbi:hypothetical protein ILUMI_11838 [Ignelater luminosus]|uniref:Uncharacterized protein n=1 Tax=Ignelater luminosus TaxID=2038154 RepID=A0A8K0CVC9_IGNLU|nr:hypothetical protein ILUMI_11838 [Ignelater luminosus]
MKTEVVFFLCCVIFQAGISTISARAVTVTTISLVNAEAQCIKDLDLDEEHIDNLDDQVITPENDNQYNSYLECAWKKVKFQDANGRIDYDAVADHLLETVVEVLAVEEDVKLNIKLRTLKSITYCQQNPPGGVNHGQIIVKLINCIMNGL